MMEHTKEPWSIAKHDKSIVICFQGEKTPHGTTPYFAGGGSLEDERNANARRVVACVNACKGIDTVELEMDNSLFIAALREKHELRQQRDELLSVLESIIGDGIHCDVVPHLHEKAIAAIAKVKGGAA